MPQAATLRERLRWNAELGALHDGPRRYLMMRPDVLMGALAMLPPSSRAEALQALAASTREHGARSLGAYADQVQGDPDLLMAATAQAAADLGWGRWSLGRDAGSLTLVVSGSPFAEGWLQAGNASAPAARPAQAAWATQPVCAPTRGMLAALAGLVWGTPAEAAETDCVACGAPQCRFVARALSAGAQPS